LVGFPQARASKYGPGALGSLGFGTHLVAKFLSLVFWGVDFGFISKG
jgi:hypothetical protein